MFKAGAIRNFHSNAIFGKVDCLNSHRMLLLLLCLGLSFFKVRAGLTKKKETQVKRLARLYQNISSEDQDQIPRTRTARTCFQVEMPMTPLLDTAASSRWLGHC